MAGTDDQSSKTISGVAGGSQGAPRSGGQSELAADLDGGRQLSSAGEQDSPSEILRGTPSGEFKLGCGGRPEIGRWPNAVKHCEHDT